MTGQRNRMLIQLFKNVRGSSAYFLFRVYIFKQQYKFIATHARSGICIANAILEYPGNVYQQRVTGFMPPIVIDLLKVIEIE